MIKFSQTYFFLPSNIKQLGLLEWMVDGLLLKGQSENEEEAKIL
jgi:hypothetical protein